MSKFTDKSFVEVHAFANADETVINWQGANYYQACGITVTGDPDSETTSCVKRVDHPGDIHEDYDGVRLTDPKGRMAVVVTFTQQSSPELGFVETQRILQELKGHFKTQPDVKVYGAVHDKADQIIMVLEGDG